MRNAFLITALLLVAAGRSVAQPTRLWKRLHPTSYIQAAGDFQRRGPNRLIAIGSPANNYRSGDTIDTWAGIWFFNNQGALVRTRLNLPSHSVNSQALYPADYAYAALAQRPDGDLLMTGFRGRSVVQGVWQPPSDFITRTDSVGNIRWMRDFTLGAPSGQHHATALPDGGMLLVCNTVAPNTSSTPMATVARFDSSGAVQWQRVYGRPESGFNSIKLLPDGSYMLAGYQKRPVGPNQVMYSDAWALRITARGDTVSSRYYGVPSLAELFNDVAPAPSGGVVLSGYVVSRLPGQDQSQGWLLALDSLGRTRWEQLVSPNPTTALPNYVFGNVWSLANGDALVNAFRNQPNTFTSPLDKYLAAYQPDGTGGARERWALTVPADSNEVHGQADLSAAGELTFHGGYTDQRPTPWQHYISLTRYTNVGTPFVPNMCQQPPQAAFSIRATASPDSLRVRESSAPGPQYGMILLWHWTFPDGSTYDGRQPPPRRLAAVPAPGSAVTLTVTNNLGCTSTFNGYPWGPLSTARQAAQWAAGASVFPNPATGAATFAARDLPAGPAALTLVNALGQTVRTWTGQPVRGNLRAALELGGLPPGVYALRVTLTGGGGFAKRLVVQ